MMRLTAQHLLHAPMLLQPPPSCEDSFWTKFNVALKSSSFSNDCALMQGFSRYDAMIRLTRSIRYTHLRSCGHLTFVGAPLDKDLVLVGEPLLTLWVESSDADADIFAYLEDQDPGTGKTR